MQCVVAISPLSEMGMQQFSLNIGLSDFFCRQNAVFVLIAVLGI